MARSPGDSEGPVAPARGGGGGSVGAGASGGGGGGAVGASGCWALATVATRLSRMAIDLIRDSSKRMDEKAGASACPASGPALIFPVFQYPTTFFARRGRIGSLRRRGS